LCVVPFERYNSYLSGHCIPELIRWKMMDIFVKYSPIMTLPLLESCDGSVSSRIIARPGPHDYIIAICCLKAGGADGGTRIDESLEKK
jgi:hypothetical protein